MIVTALVSLLAFQNAAEVVFVDGNIYTVDDAHPHASAVAVSGQKIVYVGDDSGANAFVSPRTKVIDLHGATVVPGLTDSHYHFSGVGAREEEFNLEGTTSLQDFLDRVAAKVRESKPGAWITGRGWIEKDWNPQVYPTNHDLDAVAPNNPVILTRSDGHGCVVNSLVLKMAHIDKDTKNPFGGQFMKDPATSEPTGMITDNAMGTVFALAPRPSAAEEAATTERELLLAQKRSFRLGLCEVHIPGNTWAEVAIIRRLYKSGKLKIRLYNAIIGDPDGPRLLSSGTSVGEFDGRFTIRGMKLYADGSLGSKSAWMLEPYKGSDSVGLPRLKKEETMPLLVSALKSGVQVWTHCIGDKANRTMLDWYEEALKAVPASARKVAEPRWRIEHAQLISAADIPRFASLGVIPSMQPSHAIGDLHFAESRIGMDRLSEGYAWRTLIDAGSKICGGSDAPVEQGDPRVEFYAAVARKDLKGFTGPGWHPELAVTREEALKMLTLWGAYAAFEEGSRGSLEVGKLADMTVLGTDIMKCPEMEIPKTKVLMTVVGGETVYDGR